MILHTYASLSHYADHLNPVADALPAEMIGHRWAARAGSAWGSGGGPPRGAPPGEAMMVAGFADYQRCEGWPIVYVEHGAGQTYRGDAGESTNGSYSGGDGLDRVVLFVCPSIHVATAWRRRYPSTRVVVAGAPWLDRWHRETAGPEDVSETRDFPASDRHMRPLERTRPCVALTFHWDCRLCPETRGAWPFYDKALPDLVQWARDTGVDLIGHGHPRLWPRIEPRWRALGIEPVHDLADVFDRADVLVADNTSAMYEFASLDRPVVALNAPWWRRDVEHGLRFWSHVPGPQVDDLAGLVPEITAAVSDPTVGRAERCRAVAAVYAHADGHAADRAAGAIMEALT